MRRGDSHSGTPVVSFPAPASAGRAMLLACLVWGSAAAAADANELIKEGVALRRKGDDLGALQRFQQALQIDNGPRVVAQVGLAEHALGRWVPAYEHLSQALEAKADPWVVKNRAAVTDALALVADHVGRLEILGGAPHVEVRIDGVLRGTIPLPGPLTLSTGTVTIDLSAPGFVPVQRTTVVQPKRIIRESFDALAPVPSRDRTSPPLAARTEPVATPVTASRLGDPSSLSRADDNTQAGGNRENAQPGPASSATEKPSSFRPAAKWIAWGLGGASLGVGIVGFLQMNAAGDKFDAGCGVDATGMIQTLPSSTTTLDACRKFSGQIDSNHRLSLVGFVGAAVFAGAGLALWLTEPKADETRDVSWACVPSVMAENGLWMGCNRRF